MAGMYPTNKEIQSFGKTVNFPGVDESGKFTNGDFSNPDIPPSFLDADTINLVIDNLNALVAHLGGNANNTDGEQLKKLFSVTAEANKAIKRDSQGRAKVAAPVETDDIARKAEIDAEAKARTQSMSTLAQSFQQAINAEAQARTQGDKSIADYGDPSGNRKIQVGYAGPSIQAGELLHLAGYTQAGTKLKDVTEEAVRKLLRLDAVDNTSDSQKSVKYAEAAGSAKADGGNADTVGGYRAGNGVNMLVPVVAFNVGENAGYIKLGNGLIVQWGRFFPKTTKATLVLPIPFSKWDSYSVITGDADGLNTDNDDEGYQETTGSNKRTSRTIEFSIASSRREVHWMCIGY